MVSIPNPSILDPQPKPLWCVLQRPAAIRHCHSAVSKQLLQSLMDFSDWPTPPLLRRVVPSILHSSEDVRGCSRRLWLLKLSVNRSYGPYCTAVSIATPHRAWDPHFQVSTGNLGSVRPSVIVLMSPRSSRAPVTEGWAQGPPGGPLWWWIFSQWCYLIPILHFSTVLSHVVLRDSSPSSCVKQGWPFRGDGSFCSSLGGAWWGKGAAASTKVSYLHFWPNPSPSAPSASIYTCSILSFWSHHKTVAEFQG